MKTTLAFLLCLSVTSITLVSDAGAQSRATCRAKCGYVGSSGANEGKASQTPAVNACLRTSGDGISSLLSLTAWHLVGGASSETLLSYPAYNGTKLAAQRFL